MDFIIATGSSYPSEGYGYYFQTWFCRDRTREASWAALLRFLSILIYLGWSGIFVVSAFSLWSEEMTLTKRIKLTSWYVLMCKYGALVLLPLPNIITIVLRNNCKPEPEFDMWLVATLLLLEAFCLLVWNWYGLFVAWSFLWWLKQEELKMADQLTEDEIEDEDVFQVIVRKSMAKLQREENHILQEKRRTIMASAMARAESVGPNDEK